MIADKYSRTAVAVMLIMGLFLVLPGTVAGNNIVVKGVDDRGEDIGDDGIFDYLIITVQVNVLSEGTYTVYGSIETIDSAPIMAYNTSQLSEGDGVLFLEIFGTKIFESGRDGPYTVTLRVTNDVEHTSYTHNTKMYSFMDFDPSPLPAPVIPILNENITLDFGTIMRNPLITFYPTLQKEKYKFSVSFDHIIGFADDGDKLYSSNDNVLFRGDLSQIIWIPTISSKDSTLRLNMRNTIKLLPLTETNSPVDMTVEFIFSTNVQGTYKKFDIDLTLHEAVEGVDFFALEHHLEDLTGMTEFNFVDDEITPRVQFVNGGREEMAYYEWIKEADSYSGGTASTVSLTHSYSINGQVMTLYINYPNDDETDRIFHDPVLGIKVPPMDTSEEPSEDGHSLLLFVISALVGGLFIIYTIHSQRKRD
ncbi:MAG: hypothetical protein QGH39_03010 [Candidatus Thermoplasmatota archaeon]|jgi:hypothetical protein|nr:hypothetical protein [Candidatus Thermoplasmatota archaeon]MDP7264509.1 hypothetical protein [Candidatus Thermoplasmatota archaeon]